MSTYSPAAVLAAAIRIAGTAHAGQVDHAGAPYNGHVTRVMAKAEALRSAHARHLPSWHVQAVAILHDAIEDTRDLPEGERVTAQTLLDAGIPPEVVDDVVRLTHLPNEPREVYLKRVLESVVASLVKLADTLDNTDPTRRATLAAQDPQRAIRLDRKYQHQEATLRTRLGIAA